MHRLLHVVGGHGRHALAAFIATGLRAGGGYIVHLEPPLAIGRPNEVIRELFAADVVVIESELRTARHDLLHGLLPGDLLVTVEGVPAPGRPL